MPGTRTLRFIEDKTLFANPDRGLAIQMEDSGSSALPYEFEVYLDYFGRFQEAFGTSVIVPGYWLGAWKDRDLPQAFLDRLDADFDAAREAGLKIAPRFQYATDFSYPWSGAEAEKDAPAGRMVRHLEQMATVLHENADVLSFAVFGMIGPYGEQWNSFHGNVDISGETDSGKTEANARTDRIFDAMLDAIPEDRMMTVRYPSLKQSFLAEEPGALDAANLSPREAWTGSDRARIGFNNDSFMNPNFPEKDNAPEDLAYLAREGRYVVQIGFPDAQAGTELGLPDGSGSLTPQGLRAEMFARNWDLFGSMPNEILGLAPDDPAVAGIVRDMGYRLRLTGGEIERRETAGEQLSLSLDVANEGSGSLFNPRDVAVVLRHKGTGETVRHEVTFDGRGNLSWFPHPGETRTWEIDVPLPEAMPRGRYEVLLHLPDPHARIADRPEYAIRLANQGWEAETGLNRITTVRIDAARAAQERGAALADAMASDVFPTSDARLTSVLRPDDGPEGSDLADGPAPPWPTEADLLLA